MAHLFFLFSFLVMTQAFGATSCQSDSAEISSRAKAMYAAYTKGDLDLLVEMTDPSIFELVGKEQFLPVLKQSMAQMHQMTIETVKIGKPTKTYMAGTKSVCFIPVEMFMSMKNFRGRNVSSLVAINRNTTDSPWLFLDSSGFKKHPELLGKLLPGLPKDIQMPPSVIERLP